MDSGQYDVCNTDAMGRLEYPQPEHAVHSDARMLV
jgi:hypothetical protein